MQSGQKPIDIGVATFELHRDVVAHEADGVDRAQRGGLRVEPVEQRHDGGLVRHGDVDAGQNSGPRSVAHALDARWQ